jgi:hypothetical protein
MSFQSSYLQTLLRINENLIKKKDPKLIIQALEKRHESEILSKEFIIEAMILDM